MPNKYHCSQSYATKRNIHSKIEKIVNNKLVLGRISENCLCMTAVIVQDETVS